MLVLDCNASMNIILESQEGKALVELMKENERVIVPDLYIAEIDSALSKHVRAGDFSLETAHTYLEQALGFVDEFIDMHENYIEAFDEGVRNNHSTYDMFYLTLARRNGATLFTLDRRLIALCERLKIDCVHMVSLKESS